MLPLAKGRRFGGGGELWAALRSAVGAACTASTRIPSHLISCSDEEISYDYNVEKLFDRLSRFRRTYSETAI